MALNKCYINLLKLSFRYIFGLLRYAGFKKIDIFTNILGSQRNKSFKFLAESVDLKSKFGYSEIESSFSKNEESVFIARTTFATFLLH